MGDNRIRLLQQADEAEALAIQFDRHAQQLGQVFTCIPTTPEEGEETWTGPAADRFTAQAQSLGRDIDELIESCMATARILRRRAEHLRLEAERAS